jgi:chromosome segregation ATPase
MAQKREIIDTVESRKLPRVTKLLRELPQSAEKELLLDALPHAAEIGGDKRHSFQTEVLKMTGDALQTVHATAVKTRAGYVAHAAEAKANSDAVAETFAACKQRHEAAALARDGCAAQALAAEEAHANAEYEQSRSEAARSRILEERSKLEAEKANSEKFLEGGWEGMEVSLVKDQLRAVGAEPALIAAVPGALAVQPDQRGAFDSLATQALTACLNERAETVNSLLWKNQAEEKSACSFALGAWAFADVAKNQAVAAAEKVAEAEKSLASATEELETCSANVSAHEKSLTQANDYVQEANDYVQELDAGLEDLQHVVEKDSVRPPATVPEPVQLAAAAPEPEAPAVAPVPAKNEDPPTAKIFPESISIGGC